jgi:hypothetical protein
VQKHQESEKEKSYQQVSSMSQLNEPSPALKMQYLPRVHVFIVHLGNQWSKRQKGKQTVVEVLFGLQSNLRVLKMQKKNTQNYISLQR